ncbi:unnamed protein product [Adineta ricciae]|uniref:Transmembrane protein 127 transmembrane region domain-containing protein n=1 Tax=Adineta ricciae TaxID=249248 RepID=A0A813U5C5_ADIRI|nr:unnamed protein product [Adineta ricciae]
MSPPNHRQFFSRLLSRLTNTNHENPIRKKHERNYASALCSMFAVATLAVSLSDYRWFWLLFVLRAPIPWDPSAPMNDIYQFKPNDYMELTGCIDTHSILILRLMITFICLAIVSSTIGFLLDALGPMRYGLKFMRRHAFWHILSVVLCTIVIGLSFYASELIYKIQDRTRLKIGKKIEVQFDIAYYLIVIANGLLLLAISCTLLRKYPTDDEEHFERLIDDWSRREQPLFIERSLPATVSTIPTNNEPPPEYCSEEDFLVV